MRTEIFANGIFMDYPAPPALSDAILEGLRDKWEAANEDGDVDAMIEQCAAIASPKGFVRPVTIDAIEPDCTTLSGVKFNGTLLPEQLGPLFKPDGTATVYLFTNTCGRELHEWAASVDDILLRGVADDLCLAYLRVIAMDLRQYVSDTFFPGKHFSAMNPGSLPSFHIREQAPTFRLLGEGAVRCGVSLTDSMLMVPFKSGSGIYFETAHTFESCMYCDKLDCPNRRAKYIMDEAQA